MEKLMSELRATIRLNAHDGDQPAALDDESVHGIAEGVLASIERMGLAIVPREPTEGMMQAGLYQSSHDSEWGDVYSTWKDMLSASPINEAGEKEVGR